eukprot:scaffold207_cov60-Phaeocystis_antarctica.AAC.2
MNLLFLLPLVSQRARARDPIAVTDGYRHTQHNQVQICATRLTHGRWVHAEKMPRHRSKATGHTTSTDPSRSHYITSVNVGAPFGSTKSASSHTQHPTGHVAIMTTVLSSPVNERFAASSTARQQNRLTQRAHTSGGLVHARHGAFQELTGGA